MSTFRFKHLSCLLGAVALIVGFSDQSVHAQTAPAPGTASTSASVLGAESAETVGLRIAQTLQNPDRTPAGTGQPSPSSSPSTLQNPDRTPSGVEQPGINSPGTVTTPSTPDTTTPGSTPTTPNTTPDATTPGTTSPGTTPDATTPGTTPTSPTTTPSSPETTVSPGRATRSGSSYVGIGGNIGIGDGDTALGEGSFAVISKIGLTRSFSVRPSFLIDDDVTILLPLTYDFSFGAGPTADLGFSAAPYVGIGAAISTGDDSGVDLLLTGGIDVPLSSQFTATASVNASVTGNPAVGIFLGIGYNFAGF
ncbi:hypothetical protein H6F43_17810 [Leptolyngbya sp. FACHB-36]|uniref:hypothetical protein n=1 Tax=Leptolyngbya sp. FACHB-36 TaxID=2692808 RepID=UPI001680A386|nr:hypothetical protein [Leptolyngbya sp. FACHB-36]MBD2022037.1 hypothetical protein [Leptolyngbya sp. FACHB-36]